MDRRRFLAHSAALSLSGLASHALALPGQPATCTVRLEPSQTLGQIAEDFTGLSYEAAQLADPNCFSPGNAALIGLVRRLGRHGVLRIGGNTSDLTLWQGEQAAPSADDAASARIPIGPASIRALAGFLDATGWSLLFGLNLGTGTAAQAAVKAKAVSGIVGAHRVVFQIGNEPDIFGARLRPHVVWDFPAYLAEWRRFAQAVRAAVPEAVFAGPDTAEVDNMDWIVPFAQAAGREVRFLSGHYYAEGPPTSAQTTIAKLLAPEPRLAAELVLAARAETLAERPVRMTEINSCFWGGKPGVSDVFASALWGGDMMLHLAAAGYRGVNFHGGASKSLSTALGGGPLARAWSSQDRIDQVSGSYTPIAGSDEVGFRPRPLYYGMLLAGQLCGGTRIRATLEEPEPRSASVYAVRLDTGLRVALFNKELTQPLSVALHPGQRVRRARVWNLTAPHPESREEILLAGSSVSGTGEWSPQEQTVRVQPDGSIQMQLPPASAALLLLDV